MAHDRRYNRLRTRSLGSEAENAPLQPPLNIGRTRHSRRHSSMSGSGDSLQTDVDREDDEDGDMHPSDYPGTAQLPARKERVVLHVHNSILVAVLSTLLVLSVFRDFAAMHWMVLFDAQWWSRTASQVAALFTSQRASEEWSQEPAATVTPVDTGASSSHDAEHSLFDRVREEAFWENILLGVKTWLQVNLGVTTQIDALELATLALTFTACGIALFGRYYVSNANAPNQETQDQLRLRPHADALRQLVKEADAHAKYAEANTSEQGSGSESDRKRFITEVFCIAAEAEWIARDELELVVEVRVNMMRARSASFVSGFITAIALPLPKGFVFRFDFTAITATAEGPPSTQKKEKQLLGVAFSCCTSLNRQTRQRGVPSVHANGNRAPRASCKNCDGKNSNRPPMQPTKVQ